MAMHVVVQVWGDTDQEETANKNYFCKGENYEELVHSTEPGHEVDMIPNPETKDDFILRKFREYFHKTAKKARDMELSDAAINDAGDIQVLHPDLGADAQLSALKVGKVQL